MTKPAPSSGVKVSYAEWDGLFKIHGVRLVSRFGTPSVLDQFEYLGGGDCDLDYVEVSATLFDGKGKDRLDRALELRHCAGEGAPADRGRVHR